MSTVLTTESRSIWITPWKLTNEENRVTFLKFIKNALKNLWKRYILHEIVKNVQMLSLFSMIHFFFWNSGRNSRNWEKSWVARQFYSYRIFLSIIHVFLPSVHATLHMETDMGNATPPFLLFCYNVFFFSKEHIIIRNRGEPTSYEEQI